MSGGLGRCVVSACARRAAVVGSFLLLASVVCFALLSEGIDPLCTFSRDGAGVRTGYAERRGGGRGGERKGLLCRQRAGGEGNRNRGTESLRRLEGDDGSSET